MNLGRAWVALVLSASVSGLLGCATTRYSPGFEESTYGVMIASATVRVGDGTRTTPEMSQQQVQFEVDRLRALRPEFAVPRKVVIYHVPSTGRSEINSPLKLLELRQESAQKMREVLTVTGIFDTVDFLPQILVPSEVPADLRAVRVAAARAQADALLIYSTEVGFERKVNAWVLLYATGIGAAILPGTEDSSVALSSAVLLDVATGYIYFVAEAHGQRSERKPGVYVDPEQLEYAARMESLVKLADSVAGKVQAMEGAP